MIAWEKGSKIPAEALAALIPHGLDVWYVLGGRKKGAPQPVVLRPEELEMLLLWRDLTEELRGAVEAQIRALAERKARRKKT